jgi:cytochrome c553
MMKKTVLFSMIAATVLFTGCSEETKKAASETATAAKETTQSAVKDAKEAVKETAEKAVETSKEVAQKAKEKATEAVEATKEAVAPAAEAVTESTEEAASPKEETAPAAESSEQAAASATADGEAGKALYAKCAACHGADGKTKALGKSEIIAGQNAVDLETKIAEYKAGTRNVNGMGAMMKAQVAMMSDEDIKAVAAYIATF